MPLRRICWVHEFGGDGLAKTCFETQLGEDHFSGRSNATVSSAWLEFKTYYRPPIGGNLETEPNSLTGAPHGPRFHPTRVHTTVLTMPAMALRSTGVLRQRLLRYVGTFLAFRSVASSARHEIVLSLNSSTTDDSDQDPQCLIVPHVDSIVMGKKKIQ